MSIKDTYTKTCFNKILKADRVYDVATITPLSLLLKSHQNLIINLLSRERIYNLYFPLNLEAHTKDL